MYTCDFKSDVNVEWCIDTTSQMKFPLFGVSNIDVKVEYSD